MSSNPACTGIAEAIVCDDSIFLLEGDRHHWPEGVKEEWEQQWHSAPFQIITVKDQLVFQGRVYSSTEQAQHILQYCAKKGWVPKEKNLMKFFKMLKHFTELVKDSHYLEMVFGKCDEGPTQDMHLIEATRRREVYEEAGLATRADFVCFAPHGEYATAVFKSTMGKKEVEVVWSQVDAQRRPTLSGDALCRGTSPFPALTLNKQKWKKPFTRPATGVGIH